MNGDLLQLGSAAKNLARYVEQYQDSADPKIIRAQVELIAHHAETVTGVQMLAK